jgi:hypothetical protein
MEDENKRAIIATIIVGAFVLLMILLFARLPPGVEVGNGMFNGRVNTRASISSEWKINCAEGDELTITATLNYAEPAKLYIYDPSMIEIANDTGDSKIFTVSCMCHSSGVYTFGMGSAGYVVDFNVRFTVSGSTALPTIPGFEIPVILVVFVGTTLLVSKGLAKKNNP